MERGWNGLLHDKVYASSTWVQNPSIARHDDSTEGSSTCASSWHPHNYEDSDNAATSTITRAVTPETDTVLWRRIRAACTGILAVGDDQGLVADL